MLQIIDESERKRLDTHHEVVLSRVKLFRMLLPERTTRNITVLQEC